MILVYISTLLTAAFAYFFGVHDAPACNAFAKNPTEDKEKTFHHAGLDMRLVFVIGMNFAVAVQAGILIALISTVIDTAIVWAVFTVVLNISRKLPNVPWDYIGDVADTDLWLVQKFGANAGKIQIGACAAVVVIFHVVLLFL